MTHSYYSEDTEQRKDYFQQMFFEYAEQLARNNGFTLAQFLGQIKTLGSFKKVLRQAFSIDTSLSAYADGMKEKDFQTFFNRNSIQKIVQENISNEGNFVQEKLEVPVKVMQVNKETRSFFPARIKGRRTVGYKDFVKINKIKIAVYRDAKGRFVSVK